MASVPSISRASFVVAPRVAPQAATEGLYERHAAKVQSYCMYQLGSREEAEDAVQTIFMNAFRALGRGVVPEAESAWLFKIAENVCLSRRRSSWRRGRVESPSDFGVLEEIVPGPAGQRDELIGIEDALASMPEQQRRAILLREWQGLSYREIATELEVSQSAVETLIFRARRSLAQGLEQPDSIKPTKRKSLRRALHALDLGTIAAAVKTLLAGSAAVKATAAAVAVTAAAGTAATVAPKVETKAPRISAPALVAPAAAKPAPSSSATSASLSFTSPTVGAAKEPSRPLASVARQPAQKPLRAARASSTPTSPSRAAPPVVQPVAAAQAPHPEQQPAVEAVPVQVAEQPKQEERKQEATPPVAEPAKRSDEGKKDEGKGKKDDKRTDERKQETRRGKSADALPPTRDWRGDTTAPPPAQAETAAQKRESRKAKVGRASDKRGSEGRDPAVQPVPPVSEPAQPAPTPVVDESAPVPAPAPIPVPIRQPVGAPSPDPAPAPAPEQRSGDAGEDEGNPGGRRGR